MKKQETFKVKFSIILKFIRIVNLFGSMYSDSEFKITAFPLDNHNNKAANNIGNFFKIGNYILKIGNNKLDVYRTSNVS